MRYCVLQRGGCEGGLRSKAGSKTKNPYLASITVTKTGIVRDFLCLITMLQRDHSRDSIRPQVLLRSMEKTLVYSWNTPSIPAFIPYTGAHRMFSVHCVSAYDVCSETTLSAVGSE